MNYQAMKRRSFSLILLQAGILLALMTPLAAWQEAEKKHPLSKGKIQDRSYFFKEADKDMGYTVYVPKGYDSKKSCHLILAQHGLGSSPNPQISYPGDTSSAENHA